MTVELAGLYRKILEATRTSSHSIATELEIVKAYLLIEKARFGSRLEYLIEDKTEDPSSILIPSLLIQPLAENAVKHGLAPLEAGGKITIRISKPANQLLKITVADNGVGFAQSQKSVVGKSNNTGTGLINCRNRLDLLYNGQASLECRPGVVGVGSEVVVLIPFRTEVAT